MTEDKQGLTNAKLVADEITVAYRQGYDDYAKHHAKFINSSKISEWLYTIAVKIAERKFKDASTP